jgi:hypothetical protein
MTKSLRRVSKWHSTPVPGAPGTARPHLGPSLFPIPFFRHLCPLTPRLPLRMVSQPARARRFCSAPSRELSIEDPDRVGTVRSHRRRIRIYSLLTTHYSLPIPVSPNYKIPANSFQSLDFPASHSNDIHSIIIIDSNRMPCYIIPCSRRNPAIRFPLRAISHPSVHSVSLRLAIPAFFVALLQTRTIPCHYPL